LSRAAIEVPEKCPWLPNFSNCFYYKPHTDENAKRLTFGIKALTG